MTKSVNAPSAINKIARQELIDMVPYQSARRLQAGGASFNSKVWLNANEASGAGAYQLNGENVNRYPDFQPVSLISSYADYAGVEHANLLATRGADEGIELIIRTFCRAYQDDILICPPTYGMYAISAENHGAGVQKVPMINNQLDVKSILSFVGKVKVVFLCSPGNPTGNLLNEDDIKTVIEAFSESAIVVVDEAYIEFSAAKTTLPWLANYPNMVILRTLSKAFGLAGLRCGFTIAHSEVITLLSKIIAPYPIPAPVAAIASNALVGDNLQTMKNRVSEVNQLRDDFIAWLQAQAWCEEVFPSDANFILFRTKLKNEIFNGLCAQDIFIRDQSKQLQLENCLRVSIGSNAELTLVKQTINQVLATA